MELEDCNIPAEGGPSYSKLARLSIVNCRIHHIKAHWIRIEGPFDFSRTIGFGPAPDDGDPIAWIDARGAQIEGDVTGSASRLRAPIPREDFPLGTQRYALGLGNCRIAGRIILLDGFRAIGGVSVGDGDITGEVWVLGAQIVAGEGDAFVGQSAHFGSVLALCNGLKVGGSVFLLGARIEGGLKCDNAIFDNWKPDGSAWALVVTSAEIGGDVSLQSARVFGGVAFGTARVRRDFNCGDSLFDNRTEDGLA